MTTTDANGIVFYETTDPISPLQTLLNAGQTSVSNRFNLAPTTDTFIMPGGGPFGNTSPGLFTSAAWTFTPPRTGICSLKGVIDVILGGSASVGAGYLQPIINGVPQVITQVFTLGRWETQVLTRPFRVTAGVAVNVGLNVWVFNATGTLTINNGSTANQGSRWEATVQ